MHFTLQNIAEFWNVATHPIENNGLGFTVALTLGEVTKIERVLTLLPESPAIYAEWKRLVVQQNVLGTKVHDTWLVAATNVHAVRNIRTFNGSDFTRFDVKTLHPMALVIKI